jgi:hypothetical protein
MRVLRAHSRNWTLALSTFFAAIASLAPAAQARISRITITSNEPAYGGASFGTVGAYRLVTGIAYGEVDPKDRRNALIQDIELAPRNAKGMVEYSTPFQLLMPADASKGNRTMLFEIVNRGRLLDLTYFNIGVTNNAPAGDGFLENQGFTALWAGWQADMVIPAVAPTPGRPGALLGMTAPVATSKGQVITGPVRAEWILSEPDSTRNISFPDTNLITPGYPTASLDNKGLTMTARVTQYGPRSVIPIDQWAFADCSATPFPGKPDPLKVCMKNGFDTNHIYELVYVGKNPIVMGLGLAAIRDLGAFFHNAAKDDNGTANPVAGEIRHTLINGISQSGRVLRTFLQLGFNEDEQGHIVYDGANPHIAVAGNFINFRFAQPARLAGTQHMEAQYPGSEFPVTYGSVTDSLTGKTSGILDRCAKTNTCPKIMHTMTDTEYWQSSGRAVTTDAMGKRDIEIPANVRIYQLSSNHHGGRSPVAALPAAAPKGCEQLPNTNSYTYNLRALLVSLQQWVADGTAPPPSRYSRVSDNTLVPLKELTFPKIPNASGPLGVPGVSGPEGVFNTRFLYDRGPRFNAMEASGLVDKEPPVRGKQYPSLVPRVDADGNDVAGLRSHILQAPLGTYTGWNVRVAGFSQGDSCDLVGAYIPFSILASDRQANGDTRLSLQERYTDTDGYVKAVTTAVNALVADHLMLPSDAAGAISNAANRFKEAAKGKLP